MQAKRRQRTGLHEKRVTRMLGILKVKLSCSDAK